jgi:hypothetical protein
MSRASLFVALALPPLVSLACAGESCPAGQQWLFNPYSEAGGTCGKQTETPPLWGPDCAQSIAVDAGIEVADGGDCPPAAGDDACMACMKGSCCAQAVACFATPDGGTCSSTDPTGVLLETCLANDCAEACPGVN